MKFLKETFAFFLIISSGRCFDPGNLQRTNFWLTNDRTHADLTECSLYKITYDWLLTSKYSSVIDFSQFDEISFPMNFQRRFGPWVPPVYFIFLSNV